MNPRLRLGIFLIGGVGLAMLFVAAFAALPGPVEQRDRYAEQIIGRTFVERNITDAVTAVNFDYRGFDTLGEEFILFVAVMGTLVLLREPEEKRQRLLPDAITPDRDVPPTDATRLWTLVMAAPKVLFGVYIVTHGQLSPGGGFQGGVVLATAALLLYLGENFDVFKKIASHQLVEVTEAMGAGAFALTGVLAFFYGRQFLSNVLPLGKGKELTSGGTIALVSFFTGIEVAAGFVLLLYTFLQSTLTRGEES